MVTTRVSVHVGDDKIVVKYRGEMIRELTRQEAIECGGEIAEAGKKIPCKQSPPTSEQVQQGKPTSDRPNQEGDSSPRALEMTSELSQGETYIGVVDRISSSGNAIIEAPAEGNRTHVNLGPIDRSAVGEEVKFKYSGSTWAECLTEKYIYEGYSPRDGRSSKSTSSKGRSESFSNNPFSTRGTNLEDPDNKNKLLNGHL